MTNRPMLQQFLDGELQLAQQLFATVADAVLDAWRMQLPTRLASDLDAPRVLHLHRGDFVRYACASLKDQTQPKVESIGAAPRQSAKLELALVDDDEITTDIEIARVVERANSALENELRELRTLTSALVGDVNTSRDTNPLRPEVWVRALMAGARAVPLSRTMQTALLRAAADPLIRAIRQTYVAACARLYAQGVEPAAHRTIVNEGVTTELTDAMRARRELDSRFDTHRSDFDAHADNAAPARQHLASETVDFWLTPAQQGTPEARGFAATQPPVGAVGARHDGLVGDDPSQQEQRSIDRLSSLFDSIMADRRLPRDSLPLLSRLYPGALRQTLTQPGLLDDANHPLWRLMDHLAFLIQTRAVGDLPGNLRFAQNLVEQLVGNPALEAKQFQSAIDRLAVFERQRFARAVAAADADIAELTLRLRETGGDNAASLPQSLDAGGLDSQPAPLLRRTTDANPETPTPPDQWRPGCWLTLFLRGQWRRALVLWRAPLPGPMLMLDASQARHWAVRRDPLVRLAAEGLAREVKARSLMRDALGRLARSGRAGRVTRDPGPTLFG